MEVDKSYSSFSVLFLWVPLTSEKLYFLLFLLNISSLFLNHCFSPFLQKSSYFTPSSHAALTGLAFLVKYNSQGSTYQMICWKSVSHNAVETATLTSLGELLGLFGQEKLLMFAVQEFFPLSRFELSTIFFWGGYLKTAHRIYLRQKMPPHTSQEMAEATPLGERQDYLAHYKEVGVSLYMAAWKSL